MTDHGSHRPRRAPGATGITRRQWLQSLGAFVTLGLPLVGNGCAAGRDAAPPSLPPPPPAGAPFPIWGVTFLSWNANELPTAESWQPQTWCALASPRAKFTLTAWALKNLHAEKIPGEVLGQLRRLQEQVFVGHATFLDALTTTLGRAHTEQFASVIVQYAAQQCGSLAMREVAITTINPYQGRGALELTVALKGGDLTHCAGETFVDLRYHPPQCRVDRCRHIVPGTPLDLRGTTVSAWVFAPRGSQGPADSPNGLQLFLKSLRGKTGDAPVLAPQAVIAEEHWDNFYGDWRNIEARWNSLKLRPDTDPLYGYKDPDFHPAQVGILGLKIGAGKISTEPFTGKLWLDDVTITWPDGCQARYDFEHVDTALDVLQKTAINTVALIPTWYMDDKYAGTIHRDNLRTQAKTHPDAELAQAIDTLHRRGFKVLLKPHVDVQDGTWRAEIDPIDRQAWFASYKHFITHYAWLARQHGVALFSVGTELESLQGGADRGEWAAIIRAIRQHYRGTLLYAANWTGSKQTGRTGGYRSVAFWDLLDVVGIDVYFPLSEVPNPSLPDLIQGWTHYQTESPSTVEQHNWVEELETWQAQIQKPILFTEIGYPSADSAARRPWEEPKSSSPVNLELQKQCYAAAIHVLAGKPWLQGLIWWGWSPFADAGGPCDTSYTPQHKPAQALL